MKSLKYIMFAILLLSGISANADFVASPDLEAKVAQAKQDAIFFNAYSKNLEAKSTKTFHNAQFAGKVIFKETPIQSCLTGLGGVSVSGVSGLSQPACACPIGNKRLTCAQSLNFTIGVDPADVGGTGFIVVYAEQGGNLSVLLEDGLWHSPLDLTIGHSSFYRSTLNTLETFAIPKPANTNCNGTSPVHLYVGYGAADTMDREFIKKTLLMQPTFDADGYIWSMSHFDGMHLQKSGQIETLDCSPVI